MLHCAEFMDDVSRTWHFTS